MPVILWISHELPGWGSSPSADWWATVCWGQGTAGSSPRLKFILQRTSSPTITRLRIPQIGHSWYSALVFDLNLCSPMEVMVRAMDETVRVVFEPGQCASYEIVESDASRLVRWMMETADAAWLVADHYYHRCFDRLCDHGHCRYGCYQCCRRGPLAPSHCLSLDFVTALVVLLKRYSFCTIPNWQGFVLRAAGFLALWINAERWGKLARSKLFTLVASEFELGDSGPFIANMMHIFR